MGEGYEKNNLHQKFLFFFQVIFEAAYATTVLQTTAKASNHNRALYRVNQSYSVEEHQGRDVVNL